MIPKASVAVNAGCFGLLAWIFGGDLYDVARARSSEVAAMSALPSVWFAALMVALALAGAGLTLVGLLKKRDATWRGYRVMPIIAVVGLFMDRLVLSADETSFSSSAQLGATLEAFESKANGLSSPSGVTTDGAALQAIADGLGPPPWLAKSQPVEKWVVQMKTGCSGPWLEVGAAGVGTFFYCAAADRSQAWITVVGLPLGERFGAPQLVSADGLPLVASVQKRALEAEVGPPSAQVPENPEVPSMYFEADAGNLPALP